MSYTRFLMLLCLAPGLAWAQSSGDLDGDNGQKGKASRAQRAESSLVREVERGTYVKANIGSHSYLGKFSDPCGSRGKCLTPVIAVGLAVGSDFIDREKQSFAWEFQFMQGLNNGPKYEEGNNDLQGLEQTGQMIQGDVHTLSGIVTLEASLYPSQRLGIGLRAGGGMMYVPLLWDETTYQDKGVGESWGGNESPIHAGALPMAVGGPSLEYYTKLSHFSVGADVDIYYVIGFDLAASPSGYIKYTF